MTIHQHTCDAGTVTINYAEGPPSGPPLLFLHGGSGRWQNYEDILPDLTGKFRVYAPGFRGHGRSGRVPGQYRLQDYVDDTITFLLQCVTAPAYVFGHCLGGMIALLTAARCGDHVRAVVVGDASLLRRTDHDGRGRERKAAWRDLAGGRLSVDEIIEVLNDAPTEVPGLDEPVTMRDKHGEDSGVIAWVATNLYHTDPDVLSAVMDESFTADSVMEEILPTIRCPVLLLQADPAAGGVMTEMELNWAMALLPRVQQVRLEGVGHFLFAPEKEPALRVIEQSLRPLESK